MHARLETNLLRDRVIACGLIDAIDRLDPCSRNRQASAVSMLRGRHDMRRFHRAVVALACVLFAIVVLAAFA